MKGYYFLVILFGYSFFKGGLSSVVEDDTFYMNGIFSITTPTHINYQSGVMMAEAMKYAVNEVNRHDNFLHGYKLKIKNVFDSVKDSIVRDDILKTFIEGVPFLIGPYSSETSYTGSILTGTFKQIAVSYSATYSDFDSKQQYMVRSVPSDFFRIQAALKVVEQLKWNYIGIISSYGYNGERESLHFVSSLPQINACIATQVDLSKDVSENGYENAIQTMNDDKILKAIVLFTTLEDSRSLLLAIKKLNLKDRFYILCIYGCTNYIEVVKGVEEIALGTLSIDVSSPEEPAFKEYYLNLKPTKDSPSYFKMFWEEIFNCSFRKDGRNRCTGNETMSVGNGYYPLTPVRYVIHAVHSIARAVRSVVGMLRKQSINVTTSQHNDAMTPYILKTLRKYDDGTLEYNSQGNKTLVSYDIHRYTATENIPVGKWWIQRKHKSKFSEIIENSEFKMKEIWNYENETLTPTHAFCSYPCPEGYKKERDNNIKKRRCCWDCRKCPKHNVAYNDTCKKCKNTEKPNHGIGLCTPLPRKYIRLDQTESWLIAALSVLGLASVSFVTILFIRFNDNRIVRASGRDLCYLILLGIFLTFLCPFMFLIEPTTKTCLFRGGLPGLAFICCYAPLFLRTNRIYRIFFHAKISVSRPALVSSQSQLIVSCGIVAIQMLLVVVWFVSRMPSPQETVALDNIYVNLHCKADNSPILLVLNLALSVIFMISCTILAFKTRHFPKNYNEAKYIGVTLYLSCVSWAVFFPAYFLTNPKTEFLKEYLMCAICISIGYITLFGLFGQKVRLLLFHVQNGNDGDPHPTWYLSDSESSSYKPHTQLVGTMSSHPTQDTLL